MSERPTDERLDEAIDAVAKELTRGEPRPGFAERVQSSLLRKQQVPWRVWAPRLAGGAAVLAVLALVILWQPAPDPRRPESWSVAQAPSPATRPPVEQRARTVEPESGPDNQDRMARHPPDRARSAMREPLLVPVFEDGPQLVALRDIQPLVVDINEPAGLTLDDLVVAELTVPPLDPDKEPR